ncbi:hypothetical protein [Acetobacter indonesiensis]|uniref:hypothetical protein n=1 Tax=Acetobacter indonesiensis TaxID=104101 RepID=UPI0039EB1748
MTDPRIEAAFEAAWNVPCLLGDPIACHNLDDVCIYETQQENIAAMKAVIRKLVTAALAAADAAAWRPMSDAPRDRTEILAKTRPDVYPDSHNRSGWNNRNVVIRHEGFVNDDFDMRWSVAAPVGYGGMPDDWFIGWQPLPALPVNSDALGGRDG